MVFGWGKKKKEQEQISDISVQSIAKKITLIEVSQILEDLKAIRSKTLIAETRLFANKIKPQFDELNSIAISLEKDNLKVDDIDKHLRTIVERGKKQVISVIKEETSIKIGEINSFDDVSEINHLVNRSLKRIGDVLGRQSRVIHIFAKKYASKLKDILKDLNTKREILQSLVDNYKTLEDGISDIQNNLNRIEKSKEIFQKKSSRSLEFKKSLQELENKIQQITFEIEESKSSPDYIKYLKIKEQITQLEIEKNHMRRNINDQFTKVSRPLGKYEYVSALDREQKILLTQLISDPFNALSSEKKNDIVVILQSVRKGVISGSVSVKDIDKSVQFVDRTIEVLDDFIKEKSDFVTKEQALVENLKVFDHNSFNEKNSELKRIIQNRDDLNSKIGLFKSEILEAKNLGPKLSLNIEQKLRDVSSVKYVIKD